MRVTEKKATDTSACFTTVLRLILFKTDKSTEDLEMYRFVFQWDVEECRHRGSMMLREVPRYAGLFQIVVVTMKAVDKTGMLDTLYLHVFSVSLSTSQRNLNNDKIKSLTKAI